MKDAVVIGSGPNGLAAAVALARAGRSVLVLEAEETIGGGARSSEITLPGFVHDLCSAVHPLAAASPFFRQLPLERHGLKWIKPPLALAHPFDDATAACLSPSMEETEASLRSDGPAYRKLMQPFVDRWEDAIDDLLRPPHLPRHPLLALRFGLKAMRSATGLADALFREKWAKGLFGGNAAHSFLPLSQPPSAAIGLMLGLAGHAVGWPIPQGGSQKIADALASYLKELGGEIRTGVRVRSVSDIPEARSVFFDLQPEPLLAIAGDRLPAGYQNSLRRFRPGPAAFKMDFALSGPVPWKAKECSKASTVHLGGTLEELAVSEAAPWAGRIAEKPYVLVAHLSPFDPTRAPSGKHTVWAYTHVPRGSTEDATKRIEDQIERFAPGFRDLIVGKKATPPAELERRNANLVGGDISGGIADLWQILFRPRFSLSPYRMPVKGWYLCSAATPPGAGVHGLCGYYAAVLALRDGF
ncbi:MAG TPA: NAD(P)/FAD-dependent oxidoreductase [bacterium]|nr:NAD(P)/FAD-dependent oxidoreductase [bacterium]